MEKYVCFKQEDWNYLCKKINWKDSFIDADAARIMNEPRMKMLNGKPKTELTDEELESEFEEFDRDGEIKDYEGECPVCGKTNHDCYYEDNDKDEPVAMYMCPDCGAKFMVKGKMSYDIWSVIKKEKGDEIIE